MNSADDSNLSRMDLDDPLSVQVYLGVRSYDISIGSNELARAGEYGSEWVEEIAEGRATKHRALVVTDTNVSKLHAATVCKSMRDHGWQCELHELPAGESSKCLQEIAAVYDRLVEMKADRQTVLLAVGGGVVGDAAGFVAATYARGIPFIQVPTTLLAQVDSSVGGKVGINLAAGKNLVGAFYQPRGVIADTSTLQTLPARDYKSGLAEVIKYGVILDTEFFQYLEEHVEGLNTRDLDVLRYIVCVSCRLKADVVEQDEFERTGLRAVLNYGHTFAHAFEALCGYGELLHGEAVSIGMDYAARLAQRLGRVDEQFVARQQALIEAVGLPVRLPAATNLEPQDVLDRMKLDKKAVEGQLRFVLPTRIGHVELCADVSPDDVLAVLTT